MIGQKISGFLFDLFLIPSENKNEKENIQSDSGYCS